MRRHIIQGLRTTGFLAILSLLAASFPTVLAQDVMQPAIVEGVLAAHSANDVALSWDALAFDVGGSPESVDYYKIYRGDSPDFVPDKSGGSNLVGTSPTETFTDIDGVGDPDHYYLITAVDNNGNESNTMPSLVATAPVLSGTWARAWLDVEWTDASPLASIVGYRLYYGLASGQYDSVVDVGLGTTHRLSGLQQNVNYYIVVTAVDVNGNETPFSNEHIDVLSGTITLRVHDEEELCWGAETCTPADPDKVQRNNGWQLLIPATFPDGDWTSVIVKFTVDSRLCSPPTLGTVTKCGSGNPCISPPCNGGYNPCGDPWDRAAHLFLVLDDCIANGGDCKTNNNLELIRAVTPFGSDAPPPEGTGVIAPKTYEMDITPFVPLLVGTKHVGTEIGHYVQKGWWVTVEFVFSKRPDTVSPKPPADGIEIVGWGGAPLATKSVAVPSSASEVKLRLFTTGHGGSLFCDGGSNDALSCTGNADCPGGVCNPCDEFCHRMNQIIVDGDPVWEVEPWRSDCSPNPPSCSEWNACGYPSCTYPRAGWCPGYIACHTNAPCDNDLDFTLDLPAGGTYDIDYNVTPKNGSWPISLVLYWYE